jgi:hypothetical protein
VFAGVLDAWKGREDAGEIRGKVATKTTEEQTGEQALESTFE